MPTVSHTYCAKHETGVRYSSPTRLVDDDDLTPPPRQPRSAIGLRLRADSDGSTNNAFFRDGHPPLPTNPIVRDVRQQHQQQQQQCRKKKKKKQLQPNKHSQIRSSVSDDVEEGEMADALNRDSRSNKEKRGDYMARSGWEQNGILNENTPAFVANRLGTIQDSSKEYFSVSEPYSERRNSSARTDSLMGSGLIDSSSRLSELLRHDSTTSSKQHHRSLSGRGRGSNSLPVTKEGVTDLIFTVSDDESDDLNISTDGSEMQQQDKKTLASFNFDSSLWETAKNWLNPSPWLIADVKFDDHGTPYFEPSQAWTMAGFVRHYLYDPVAPEFTSLQQFWWAVMIGIAMGIYTAVWKLLIEAGVDFVWETIPETLLELGFFTDIHGSFPIYHYMWICPMVFSAALSYIFCILPVPIPGQNEWIKNLHARGVQDYRTFWPLFVLATLGMLSGLSLGPELPLVLTAGMFGSWLGILCQQSMLQARVLNLTAASAAVGGFFGFPMAGALFVLEIPHRMGLQYFEALSPATISSIVAVLANRIITGNDVTGYFKYPFLSDSLPSQIFTHAIIYGLYGAAIGTIYAFGVMKLKGWVHDWFHARHHEEGEELQFDDDGSLDYQFPTEPETTPLVDKPPIIRNSSAVSSLASFSSIDSWSKLTKWSKKAFSLKRLKKIFCCVIPYEPYRAAVGGAIAGALCGSIAMFVPHTLFWGEAQLQNLIDRGRTPLPVFGQGDEPTADLTALGYCIIDPNDIEAIKAGFSMECSLLLMISKTVVIGLSLGTGIIGGHFWGPLFIGCAASHFLSDLVKVFHSAVGFGGTLAAYPCLIILCTMGSAHVVTFRAHTAIMLILTLTISSFTSEDNNIFSSISGDYSAVFPLLVISCFVSLMVSRQSVVFYKEQRSRGDITAVPEVLCEPGMQGRPLVSRYDPTEDDDDNDDDGDGGDMDGFDEPGEMPPSVVTTSSPGPGTGNYRPFNAEATQDDIEKAFTTAKSGSRGVYGSVGGGSNFDSYKETLTPFPLSGTAAPSADKGPQANKTSAFSRLDELLNAPMDQPVRISSSGSKKAHRRTQSAPAVDPRIQLNLRVERKNSGTRFDSPSPTDAARKPLERQSSRSSVVRVEAFGELHEHQPPLLEQARLRAASRELINAAEVRKHRRSPSTPVVLPSSQSPLTLISSTSSGSRNSRGRRSCNNSVTGVSGADHFDLSTAFSLDQIEASFNAAVSASMNPKSMFE